MSNNLRANFERRGDVDWITVAIVGDPNTVERKVRPEDQQRFAREWEAFQTGRPAPEPEGTPLTEVEGVTKEIAEKYRHKKVRTAEELASLSDIALKALGVVDSYKHRRAAQALVEDDAA
jgi:hypothetical protein